MPQRRPERDANRESGNRRTATDDAAVDEQQDPRGALTADERAELTRLRRERRAVQMERDFLIKLRRTAAYFAKSQS